MTDEPAWGLTLKSVTIHECGDMFAKHIATWNVVEGTWLTPGWYRRADYPNGEITFRPLTGLRLWRHRILWGFGRGLVDAR